MADRDSVLKGNQIQDATITENELNTSVAGNGVTGGGGSPLAVDPDITSTTTTEANAVNVGANGIGVKVDDSTLEGSGQGASGTESLRIKASGVGANELNEGDNYNFTAQLRVATTPSVATDVANKSYVDGIANGLKWKDPVRIATTANITLSGEQTIDGVLTSTDRVLVKDQTSGSENGIYVSASGAWSRASDADVSAEVVSGIAMFVNEGTVNADTGYVLTTDDPITLDSTVLTFTKFTGLGQITAGNGLTKSADIISALADILSTTTTEANAVIVASNGLSVKVDDSTLEGSLQGIAGAESLRVKALGIANAQIANDTILESKLNVTNAPTDGFFLTYDNATGGFTWVASPAVTALQEADAQYDDFSATTNGVLTDFTLTDIPVIKSLMVFINGQLIREGTGQGYLLNPDSGDTKNIRILGDVLATGEKLEAYYFINN